MKSSGYTVNSFKSAFILGFYLNVSTVWLCIQATQVYRLTGSLLSGLLGSLSVLALCSSSLVPPALSQEKIRAQEQWESQGASFV